jgi:predicted DNA-binding antitoxin AbrB/MazE fold protein
MSAVLEAIYENGTLKLAEPLPLPEGTRVRLTVVPADEVYDPLAAVIGIGESGRTDGAEHHDRYIHGMNRP